MNSLIIYGGGVLALLFLVWRIIAAFNAPKVAKEDTAQAGIKKEAQDEKREDRLEMIDKRHSWREKLFGLRRGRRGRTALETPGGPNE